MLDRPRANQANEDKGGAIRPPSIVLPKGGGAIRGIGEKFAANPVTGTGSMTIPIATSPGRSGFGPQLALSYDSGAGNGPFGFGWSLSLPAITRKTDKGLPQYFDAEESDVCILSGAEDLVPVLEDHTSAPGYTIRRYRPRIEGLFARIERWTGDNGDVHWRSISKDNILTVYGKDAGSRIFDAEDHSRIFAWLICETRDDKGNAAVYTYKSEDGRGVDLTRAHERNRGNRDDPRRGANRYLKRIQYGNRVPLLDNVGRRPRFLTDKQFADAGWMFEVVFDYGEHDANAPKPNEPGQWAFRADPFSSYRAGFEVRTTRLCQRVLMFHHFEAEAEVGKDCLLRSTDFTYSYEKNPADARNPIYSFLLSATQTGYRRTEAGGYLARSLPSIEFEYTQPVVQEEVQGVDAASLENLPIGVDGTAYQWTDLHGEGIPGILTEQADAWFYKRNISPIGQRPVEFAPVELVTSKPSLGLAGGQAQFMDLAGDGQPDLVVLDGPMPGFYEHDEDEGWQGFQPFASRVNRDTRDPNLKFVDLNGDGHSDVLITEDGAFIWHASLAEDGFGPACRIAQALDEEKGPHLVFADGTQSIYLADLSGDGLTDLVRIRNGEVCYWPNLGYGRFGAKVTMDQSPLFDNPDQFDEKRIRLADIDGSGTTDIIYLHRDGVRLYFNQSGNSWSAPQVLRVSPRVDDLASIVPADLMGNGTACLIWSSPLPGDARQQMRYVDLMGGQKPHLLVRTVNNLGAETRVRCAPSTKFYLQDKRDGRPWITRLPFPVHVVDRVETYDRISGNRFVTRYAYHHGYFDGVEREFRGFGMVEQWDTEEIGSVPDNQASSLAANLDAASFVPPIHTKTWFHTGVYLGRDRISRYFAGLFNGKDKGEYYREPAWSDDDEKAKVFLLDDTVLPEGWTVEEEREACRALKGSMLRQEIYALDGTEKQEHPYTVTEQNFTIERLQPKAGNRHGVFFAHPREAISYHYERDPDDPRISHALTLEVDKYGNVLRSAAIGYGRKQSRLAEQADRDKQTRTQITYTENEVTRPPPSAPGAPVTDAIDEPDNYRAPLPSETRTYELTGLKPANNADRFSFDEWVKADFALFNLAAEIPYEEPASHSQEQKRLIEHVRTLYRRDDLTGPLALGSMQPLGLPFESYKLALTPGLAQKSFVDSGKLTPTALNDVLANEAKYGHSEGDANWWIPSGKVFYGIDANSADPAATAAQELAEASGHFFLPRKFTDPFGHSTTVDYDSHDLLVMTTEDAVGNTLEAQHDYRVLQPMRVTDPNGNRTEVAFDALGMVAGTVVMGKTSEALGDSLAGFEADLATADLIAFANIPRSQAAGLLKDATTRIVYDLDRFRRCGQPPFAATLARETHASDPLPAGGLKIQISFGYSDGFGRELQTKIQAEPGLEPQREPEQVLPSGDYKPGKLILENGKTKPMPSTSRWVGKGRTVYNNKGKPIKQYEPFFSGTHLYEEEPEMTMTGVTPILFYDPVERVVATLHPNHTYEKVVFDAWRQETWDVNDTVTLDPQNDDDVSGFFLKADGSPRLQPKEYLPTWHALRTDPAHAAEASERWPDPKDRDAEKKAAEKAASHAGTPAIAHLDTLGRTFLTIADNGADENGNPRQYPTRVMLDIEGNQREVIDALDRKVMTYDYDMLSNRTHQASMEAGARWMLNDVAGKPIRAWDSRGHTFRTEYDPLRRPLRSFVTGADPANPNQELLTERLVYGEQHPEAELRNLRGKLYLHLDQAGVVASESHDFKGNPLRASRRIATEYKQALNWNTVDAVLPANATAQLDPAVLEVALAPRLQADTYTSSTTYDALNRPVTLTTPHTPTMQPSVIRPGYNEANLLERVDANLRGATANGQPVWTPFVSNIDYDAKGQRQRIDYGNGASTFYDYDPLTFRLVHLLTRRNAVAFPDDCPQPPPAGWPGCQVQNLHYTYDPAGNITYIRDDAQQTIYFRNKRVEPSADFTYDAIYRLIEATGREHLGQVGGSPIPHSYNDTPRVGLLHRGDGNAMGTYMERYVYDVVGNILSMQHSGGDPSHPGWTRTYAFEEPSQLEPGKQSNRLTSTTVGGTTETYSTLGDGYNAHGSMLKMPHLPDMWWDFHDQLRQVDLGGGGTAYYVYDASGQRVRKVIERQNGTRQKERVYLGGFEVYREYDGGGNAVALARETLYIMDDQQRIALVETRTVDTAGNDPAPQQLIRYQFSNHLGSASLELDDQAQIISYEEYTPYGSTSYQAVRSQTETPRRNRCTGKERDEETGLYYHGARYYAPWIGRWTACDPIGVRDGLNVYAYARDNPIGLHDPSGTQGKKPAPPATFTPPDIPDFTGDKAFSKTITWGGRSVEAHYFPGTSGKTVLILGGVHQDERKAIALSNELLNQLQSSKDKPFYNIVFIPNLFGGRNTTDQDIDKTPTNRNFPGKKESLADAAKRGKGVPMDVERRKILPENVILLALVEKVKPQSSLSIHSHSVVTDLSQIEKKGAGSATVDPKPGADKRADFYTTEIALAASKAGVPVPGNMVTGDTARTRYPTDTAPHKPGETFGQWGSHQGGMNQYLIETEGKLWPKKPSASQQTEVSHWVQVIQSKYLAGPQGVVDAAVARKPQDPWGWQWHPWRRGLVSPSTLRGLPGP